MQITRFRCYVLLSLVLALLCVVGCSRIRQTVAPLRSTDTFGEYADNNKIRYEEGTIAEANAIYSALDHSITQVERTHYGKFKQPVVVYICASQKRFEEITGATSTTYAGVIDKLYISPLMLSQPNWQHILGHELSHLHLVDSIGLKAMASLPVWFKEGLAETTADDWSDKYTYGYVNVKTAIVNGKHFKPTEENSIFSSEAMPVEYRQMFYPQASLFVNYLRLRGPDKLKEMVTMIEAGHSFKEAFKASYKTTTARAFNDFKTWAGQTI